MMNCYTKKKMNEIFNYFPEKRSYIDSETHRKELHELQLVRSKKYKRK